jgi:hypothetical protein
MTELNEVIQLHILEALAKTHTSTVGRVVKVNATTVDIQPVINMVYKGEDLALPVFAEVPPVFMQGGTSYTAHPVKKGDYALVVFTERSFDRWYSGSDGARPPELRMHDYSDGFAFVGVNPASKAIQIPAVITQIGDTYQQGNYEHIGNRTQVGNFTLTGNMIINGNLNVTGQITAGSAVIGGVTFNSHVHPQGPDSAGNAQQNTGAAQ